MIESRRDPFFPALTGVRAVAAYFVFIHHYNPFSEKYFGKAIHDFFSEMHVGVTLFFVLSGLLITLKYHGQFKSNIHGFYNYMIKRFAKIYPVYFLILTLNFIYYSNTDLFLSTPYHGYIYYIGGITLLKGFFEGAATTFVGQSWSLTVEECFYLFCPFILIALRKNIRNLIRLPVLIILSGCVLVALFTKYPFYGLFGGFRFLFNFTFFGRTIEFFTGAGLAFFYLKKKKIAALSKINFTYTGILFIILCIWLISLWHTSEHNGDYFAGGIFVNNFLLPVTGVSLFYYGLLTEKTIISKILSTDFVVMLGKSSYAFYLVHAGIFSALLLNHFTQNIIILFIALNIISIAIYYLYELPMHKLIKRKLLKRELIISSAVQA